jgi:hypothetical protein
MNKFEEYLNIREARQLNKRHQLEIKLMELEVGLETEKLDSKLMAKILKVVLSLEMIEDKA